MTSIATDTRPEALLETMMLVRAYEEKLRTLAAGGNFPGTCTSVGQEASAVGVIRALSRQDKILTNHRSAGHLLARGADPKRMLAEVMGRQDGYCGGKSGSLHISVKELGVILTSTIVGGELSLVTGVGLSQQMLGTGGIAVCFFGDGAACEGIFHESVNLSSVWNLPVLYVCENNQWQAFVARREAMPIDHVSDWGKGYGLESMTVDGNDVEAVLAAAQKGVERIRETGKPYFLETYTYRMKGHYEPDDQSYVNPKELAAWAEKDPIDLLRNRLLARGTLSPGDVELIRQRVEETIDNAVAFANQSPFPEMKELTTHVYA